MSKPPWRRWAIRRALPLAIVVTSIALGGCSGAGTRPVSKTELVLDTACTISIYDQAPAHTLDRAFALLNQINATMTIDSPGSELEEVNKAAGIHPVKVDPELYAVIADALRYARLTSGAFDITVGTLTKLWGIGRGNEVVPPRAEITRALGRVDYRNVALNNEAHTVYLSRPGMVIDLGGIAKGYAGDQVAALLEKAGVHHALIDLGGNIVAIGSRPDGSPWRIGIQDPNSPRGDYVGVVEISNKSVVSSGQYERFFDYKGRRYGHILSTTTGFPVSNGISSATIIASRSTDADALSTSVFALGVEKGLALINSLPNVEAIILTDDDRVYLSTGMKDSFRITDGAYSLASRSRFSVPAP